MSMFWYQVAQRADGKYSLVEYYPSFANPVKRSHGIPLTVEDYEDMWTDPLCGWFDTIEELSVYLNTVYIYGDENQNSWRLYTSDEVEAQKIDREMINRDIVMRGVIDYESGVDIEN